MQILTGGSFVKLEQKDKIENLIFTAREMANAALETDGFVNEAENNKRIALEIWQGAEYMTLDHEEAQVKNLFVNNFLDRLREIGGAVKPAATISENAVGEVDTPTAPGEIKTPKDEFLGLVSTEEVEEKSAEANGDAVEARTSKNAESALAAPDENSVAEVKTDAAETVETATESAATIDKTANQEIEAAASAGETLPATIANSEGAPSGDRRTENGPAAAKVPDAITLPEKEPYRWEKCTVTATIQLLPTADDSTTKRKAVLSVRTHDFAPQFAVVELGGEGEELLGDLLPALRESLEKYKSDLPLKVMDKMKKEKSAAKKHSSKTTVAATTNAAKTSAAVSQPATSKTQTGKTVGKPENKKPATATTAAPKPIAALAPAASGQQGSLFNF